MAGVSYPTAFQANFVGKSREGGEFEDRATGDKVEFGDNFDITFESSEGLMQTAAISRKAWEEACDVKPEAMTRFQPIQVVGDVSINQVSTGDGGRFQRARFVPTTIAVEKPAAARS